MRRQFLCPEEDPLTPQPPLPHGGEGEQDNKARSVREVFLSVPVPDSSVCLPLCPEWERGLGGEGNRSSALQARVDLDDVTFASTLEDSGAGESAVVVGNGQDVALHLVDAFEVPLVAARVVANIERRGPSVSIDAQFVGRSVRAGVEDQFVSSDVQIIRPLPVPFQDGAGSTDRRSERGNGAGAKASDSAARASNRITRRMVTDP
jgi:hypothetical protein